MRLVLVTELAKDAAEFDFDLAQKQIAEIAQGIQEWPNQWDREKTQRRNDPAWHVPVSSIRRIAELAQPYRDPILPPQLDARIVICELLNGKRPVFPSGQPVSDSPR